MLHYTPKQNPQSAMLFSVSCGAAALLLYALSSYIAHRFFLLPILSMTILALGIWFLYRFALVSYRYQICDGVLCVIRCLFKTERTVYTLSLRTGIAIAAAKDSAAKKQFGNPCRTHNFLSSWPQEHAVILYYRDGGRLCSVILDDNPAFFSAASKFFTNSDEDFI